MKKIILILATALAVFGLSGCGNSQPIDDVDYAQYCADHVMNQVAPDQMCQSGNPRFAYAYSDVGGHQWSNGYDNTPPYVFVPVGRPLPMGITYSRPYDYSYHAPLRYSAVPVQRRVTVPYKQYVKTAPRLPKGVTPAPAAKPAASTPAVKSNPGIQRGGFGVPTAPRPSLTSTPTFSGRTSSPTRASRPTTTTKTK